MGGGVNKNDPTQECKGRWAKTVWAMAIRSEEKDEAELGELRQGKERKRGPEQRRGYTKDQTIFP